MIDYLYYFGCLKNNNGTPVWKNNNGGFIRAVNLNPASNIAYYIRFLKKFANLQLKEKKNSEILPILYQIKYFCYYKPCVLDRNLSIFLNNL